MGARVSPITEAYEWAPGEDRSLRIRVHEGDNEAVIPTGIQNWALTWTLRQEPADDEVILTKTKAAGQITTPQETDPKALIAGPIYVVRVQVARADTLTLPEGRYYYTLRRMDAGNTLDLAKGPAILSYSSGR